MARILVVDDDDELRAAMRLALERDGHEVETAATAREAIRRFDRRRPDLLVSDVCLPGNGLTVVDRARDDAAPVPALAITGMPSPELHARFRRQGVELLEKPFDLERFRDRVGAALDAG